MSTQLQTTGIINYVPDVVPPTTEEMEQISAAAAVEPILLRWRDRCPEGLIDDKGKVRNLYKKESAEEEDNLSRVIRATNEIPEAVAELEVALEAHNRLNALSLNAFKVPVLNARLLGDASLDTTGFQLVDHESKVTDWLDDGQIANIYYEEIAELVKRITGATHAFSNNHLRRQTEPEIGGNGPLAKLMAKARGPAKVAHTDFTEIYGECIIATVAADNVPHTQTFGLTDAIIAAGITEEELRASRLLVFNTWRSVGPEPLRRLQLAVADKRTVDSSRLRVRLEGKIPSGQPRGGLEAYDALYDPEHKWYYYPGMTPDEVLLFMTYDSEEVPLQPTLHTAFDDLNTPPDAAERTSVEVRVLCLLPRD